MRKLIFALFFGMSVLHAVQSGCGISLYYGNGILQDKDERTAKRLWEMEVRKLKREYPELSDSVLSAKTSYNSSYLKGVEDFIESATQYTAGQALSLAKLLTFQNEYALKALEPLNALAQAFNYEDLQTHIKAYNQDLQAGNGVVVVAHSQGNFFANTAYESLKPSYKKNFRLISVASPALFVAAKASNRGHKQL